MFSKHNIKFLKHTFELPKEYRELMDNYEYSKAFDFVWEKVQSINKEIDNEKPWMLAKAGEMEKLNDCLNKLGNELVEVATLLSPFIPNTAEKILGVFNGNEVTPPAEPLFPKN
jgi:methionyl-tRNA synthetase